MENRTWRILLVEDDEDDYILTRDYLDEANESQFELSWVKTVDDALKQLSDKDAILVDYDLGIGSGLDFIRQAVSRGYKAPIILLTGHGSYELDMQAMEIGASEYLTKSEVTPSLLERAIRYSVEQKRTEETLRQVQEELELRVEDRTRELLEANTRLKQANEQLAYQAHLLETVNDAVIASDENFILTSWNHAAEEIYGWRAEEVLGRPGNEILQTELAGISPSKSARLMHDYSYIQGEAVQIRKDGRHFLVEYKVVALRDEAGNINGYVSVNRDITERKRMEAELNEVHRRLMDGREAERLHLSQELHDGPIQILYGLTYRISDVMRSRVNDPDFEPLAEKLTMTLDEAQQVIDVLREICGELRPPTLAPFGLEQTIRSHANRFVRDYPTIGLDLELDQDKQILPERLRLALFRIYQHAMVNVARHAQATKVLVRFRLNDQHVRLEVYDNGQGFQVPPRWIDFVREGHLGLAGIAERVEAIGGKLDIRSSTGKGTALIVSVPRGPSA